VDEEWTRSGRGVNEVWTKSGRGVDEGGRNLPFSSYIIDDKLRTDGLECTRSGRGVDEVWTMSER
jgi:hypothetical protein